jgi:hypothetical protein
MIMSFFLSQSKHPRAIELIDRYLLSTITDEESRELETILCSNAEAREIFRRYCSIDSALRQQAAEWTDATWSAPKRPRSFSWFERRPLMTASASLVVGLLSASLAWAFVGLPSGRVMTLLQESFESGPAPSVTGVPIEPERWSGDYSDVVGEQRQVKPASGVKMLRFLRGDYEGMNIPSSHSSDVFRLVDLRSLKREYADGGAVVQLTAVFNAVPFPEEETFHCTLTIFALDASLVGNAMMKATNTLSTESLAYSRSSKIVVDRDPATWQKVSNELRLPPETDYLMLRIGMSNDTKSQEKRRDSFNGYFVDKVQLVFARRSEISVP